jgi:hypothetical protein
VEKNEKRRRKSEEKKWKTSGWVRGQNPKRTHANRRVEGIENSQTFANVILMNGPLSKNKYG